MSIDRIHYVNTAYVKVSRLCVVLWVLMLSDVAEFDVEVFQH